MKSLLYLYMTLSYRVYNNFDVLKSNILKAILLLTRNILHCYILLPLPSPPPSSSASPPFPSLPPPPLSPLPLPPILLLLLLLLNIFLGYTFQALCPNLFDTMFSLHDYKYACNFMGFFDLIFITYTTFLHLPYPEFLEKRLETYCKVTHLCCPIWTLERHLCLRRRAAEAASGDS